MSQPKITGTQLAWQAPPKATAQPQSLTPLSGASSTTASPVIDPSAKKATFEVARLSSGSGSATGPSVLSSGDARHTAESIQLQAPVQSSAMASRHEALMFASLGPGFVDLYEASQSASNKLKTLSNMPGSSSLHGEIFNKSDKILSIQTNLFKALHANNVMGAHMLATELKGLLSTMHNDFMMLDHDVDTISIGFEIPKDISFLSGTNQAKLLAAVADMGTLTRYCERGIPGARSLAVDDLTTAVNHINRNLRIADNRITGYLGHVSGHLQEAVIASTLERQGETIQAFKHVIPNSEVDVVSQDHGRTIYNQMKSGGSGDIALASDEGERLKTQLARTVTAAITSGVDEVRYVGPRFSAAVIGHIQTLNQDVAALYTQLLSEQATARPASVPQNIYDALKVKAATQAPLGLTISHLII